MAITNLTGQKTAKTFQNLMQISSSGEVFDGLGNLVTFLDLATNIETGSLATTGSNSFLGNQIVTGSLIATQGITGSFSGSGANLYGIPASAIVSLNLSQISSGSVSASISPNNGLQVNTNVTAISFTGSLLGTSATASHAPSYLPLAGGTIAGSLTIQNNLTVLGSASIQYISESVLNIGTNTITVNTFTPSVRFGGLSVIDSGSSPTVSASLLYDSLQDEFIFVHKGTSASAITSSHFVLGPETYNNLGDEIYLSPNRIPKSVGNKHLNDSNITDSGTIVSINSNTQVTGSLIVTQGITGSFSGSGADLYGIPATAILNLNLAQISSGTAVASISEAGGFRVNKNTTITGSLTQGIPGNIASGLYSHAEGYFTTASGLYSHAEGFLTKATGEASHAEGGGFIVDPNIFVEIGNPNGYIQTDYFSGAPAAGSNTNTLILAGDQSGGGTPPYALNSLYVASDTYSFFVNSKYYTTIPVVTSAVYDVNTDSTTFTLNPPLQSSYSFVYEAGSIASGLYSHAEGQSTQAQGTASHAEGFNTVALGNYQHVQGQYNQSSSAQSAFIVGNGTSDANRSNLIFASGSEVQITGSLKVTQGITGSLFGTASYVTGSIFTGDNRALSASYSVTSSHALTASLAPNYVLTSTTSSMLNPYVLTSTTGSMLNPYVLSSRTGSMLNPYVLTSTTSSMTVRSSSFALTSSFINPLNQNVTVTGSLVIGSGSIASGDWSHAEGISTIASGTGSHAEGLGTSAIGSGSHAEGSGSKASGHYSHAEGRSTIASGPYSHAEGSDTTASADYSHAEGAGTRAIGDRSHAEGQDTIAQGDSSHAEGTQTKAIGAYSHAEGQNTIAAGLYQHVQGQYNITSSESAAFIHGNGSSDAARSNLIYAVGNQVQITGSLKVQGAITSSLGFVKPGAGSQYLLANGTTTAGTGGTVFPFIGNAVITGSTTSTQGFIKPGASNEYLLADGTTTTGTSGAVFPYIGTASISGPLQLTGSLTIGTDGQASGLYSQAQGNKIQALGPYSHAEGIGFSVNTNVSASIDINITEIEFGNYYWYTPDGPNNTPVSISPSTIVVTGDQTSGISTPYTVTSLYVSNNFNQGFYVNFDYYTFPVITSVSYDNVTNRTTYSFNPPLQSIYYWVDGYGNKAIGPGSHAEGLGTRAIGTGSHAEGWVTQASGSYSHAEGYETIARGAASHAEGEITITYGYASHAEGLETTTLASYSHAEGRYSISKGYASHAEGSSTLTSGSYSHAEGVAATASGDYSHAEGSETTARGAASHAEGRQTIAQGDYSHAEGLGTIASGAYQHVQGQYNIPSSAQSAFIVGNGEFTAKRNLIFASGSEVQITGSLKVTQGITGSLLGTASWAQNATTAPGYVLTSTVGTLTVLSSSFAISSSRAVTSSFAISSSRAVTSSFTLTASLAPNYVLTSTTSSMTVLSSSFALTALTASYLSGYVSPFPYTGSAIITGSLEVVGPTTITGSVTSTEGFIKPGAGSQYLLADGNTTSGTGGAAFPYNGNAVITGSLSQGSLNTAFGSNSHAEGYQTVSSGSWSHAEGRQTIARADYSHAEGSYTLASGESSHAEGVNTIASGNASHAEGAFTVASGYRSHAEGNYTSASGDFSHAEGGYYDFQEEANFPGGNAIGNGSHAEGLGTVALGNGSHVQGQYNISSSVAGAFIHGNGTSDAARSNLIYAAGTQVQITGSLKVSGSITGSLFGTASYATTAGNGGVTQILAGTNVTLSPTNGLGQVTINATGGGNASTSSYGSFYDTGSVVATSATLIYSMSLSTTDISNGVFVSSSNGDRTKIAFTNAGIYNVQFSAQFSNSDNSTQDVVVWIRKNGTNIEDSAGTVGVPPYKAGSNGQVLASWNYYISSSANDYIQMCWHAEQANVITLETIAAGASPTHPRTPSLILTAQRIDELGSAAASSTFPYTGDAQILGSLNVTGPTALTGSLTVTSSAATLGQFTGNQDGYVEFSVRNTSTGVSASGDIVVYADNGTTSNNYIDMGIHNSGMTSSYSYFGTDFGNALDGYLYNVGGNLRIGNATSAAPYSQSLFLFSNPTATPNIWITGSQVAIGKSTGNINGSLDISGSTVVTGSLLVSGSATFTGPISASNYQTSWSDFSSQTVISGFAASFTRKSVRYMTIGKLGIVEYDILGTGQTSAVANFTLPFTASGNAVTQSNNNQCFSSTNVPSGQAQIVSGSTTVVTNYYNTALAFGAWATSGVKGIRGVLILEIA